MCKVKLTKTNVANAKNVRVTPKHLVVPMSDADYQRELRKSKALQVAIEYFSRGGPLKFSEFEAEE